MRRFQTQPQGKSAALLFHHPLYRHHGIGADTPQYLIWPTVPERLAAALPEARIIILLRDPVERFLSQMRMAGGSAGAANFGEKDVRRILRGGAASVRHCDTVFPGLYDTARNGSAPTMLHPLRDSDASKGMWQFCMRPKNRAFRWTAFSHARAGVERWMQHFPRSQVLLLRSEDLVAHPAKVYSRVLEFAGLDPALVELTDDLFSAPARPAYERNFVLNLSPEMLREIEVEYAADKEWLAQAVASGLVESFD